MFTGIVEETGTVLNPVRSLIPERMGIILNIFINMPRRIVSLIQIKWTYLPYAQRAESTSIWKISRGIL